MAFIGATEYALKRKEIKDNALFALTGEIGYYFHPEDFFLGLFGIKTVTMLEVMIIVIVFVLLFVWRRRFVDLQGIDLIALIIDDIDK